MSAIKESVRAVAICIIVWPGYILKHTIYHFLEPVYCTSKDLLLTLWSPDNLERIRTRLQIDGEYSPLIDCIVDILHYIIVYILDRIIEPISPSYKDVVLIVGSIIDRGKGQTDHICLQIYGDKIQQWYTKLDREGRMLYGMKLQPRAPELLGEISAPDSFGNADCSTVGESYWGVLQRGHACDALYASLMEVLKEDMPYNHEEALREGVGRAAEGRKDYKLSPLVPFQYTWHTSRSGMKDGLTSENLVTLPY